MLSRAFPARAHESQHRCLLQEVEQVGHHKWAPGVDPYARFLAYCLIASNAASAPLICRSTIPCRHCK